MEIPYSPVPDGISMFTLKDVIFSDSFGFKIQDIADESVAVLGFRGHRLTPENTRGPEEAVTIGISMHALEQLMLIITNNYMVWRESH